MATALWMNSMVVDEKSFKLDEIKGAVHTIQKLTLGTFENATVTGILKGPVKNSSYHKHVNVSLELIGEGRITIVQSLVTLFSNLDRIELK